jgi:hypothetical protein
MPHIGGFHEMTGFVLLLILQADNWAFPMILLSGFHSDSSNM